MNRPNIAPNPSHRRPRCRVRVSWAILGLATAATILAGWLAIPFARHIASRAGHGESDAVWEDGPIVVGVTGRAFGWRFRLAGPDGRLQTPDDREVDREMRLPVDARIRLVLTSDDYVYSFWAPGLRWRHIAVPEMTFELDYCTGPRGQFDLVADPMCGVRLLHDAWMGRIVVEETATFHAWFQELPRLQDPPGKRARS